MGNACLSSLQVIECCGEAEDPKRPGRFRPTPVGRFAPIPAVPLGPCAAPNPA